MYSIFLFNPPSFDNRSFTREGRCTQESGVWATLWPPVSLTTASAILEKDEHQIQVVDFPAKGWGVHHLIKIIQKQQPDFAIWNTGTPTLSSDLQLAKLIKIYSPLTITGVIGTHVTVNPAEALEQSSLDIVIRGEPELIIQNICRHEKNQWETINGISYRKQETGKIYHNPAERLLPADTIPAPAWHHLDIKPYRLPLKGNPFLMVTPVRGCPYRCSFCTAPIYYGKKLRKRPIENVIHEIEVNISRHKINDFFIWADTFTVDRNYVKKFCQAIINRGFRVSWTCNSRVDTIDPETLFLMKKAGLWMISFGLESGNDKILASTGKDIRVEQSVAAVSIAHQLGIKVAGHFIFGLPGETEKTMEETLKLALELPMDIAQFYVASPFPGTRLYEEALRNGWLRLNARPSQEYATMDLPGLPSQKVNDFRRLSYKKFYSRPKIFLKLLSMTRWQMVPDFPVHVKRFLKWTS
jgi:radical SAM superfamily enzyme YgiQ (UPF0313 family)